MASSLKPSVDKDIPKTMRAWRVIRRVHPTYALGKTSSALVSSDLDDGEVLVKVGAAALNPAGYIIMGLLPNFAAGRPLTVAEYDISGTVIASTSPLHAPSDKVFGYLDLEQQKRTKQGAICEYTRFPAECLFARPPGMSAIEASGISLAAQTAYVCLVEIAKIQPGQVAFVNGGSSSVGAFGIQIARAKGAIVWASASGKNEGFVTRQGAEKVFLVVSASNHRALIIDQFFDYTKEPLSDALARTVQRHGRQLDIIIDAVGLQDPTLFTRSPEYLVPSGVFVSASSAPTFSISGMSTMLRLVWEIKLRPLWVGGTPRKYTFATLTLNRKRLEIVGQMLKSGEIKPVIDSVFEFDDVLEAYERQMSKRATGKIIISIDREA